MEEKLDDLIKQVSDLSEKVKNLEQYLYQRNKEVQEIIDHSKKLRDRLPNYKKFPNDDYQI
jgi:outer membrane murein-binding lipoprotein Lpp